MTTEQTREGQDLTMDLATDPSVVRRDRLLGAIFAADPEACLIQHADRLSQVVSTSAPPQIFLLPTRDREAAMELPAIITSLLDGRGIVPTHVVAVGGGPAIVAALEKAKASAKGPKLGFHHVDDASRYAHVGGEKSELLQRAAENIRVTEAPTPERIHAAIMKGRTLAQRDQRAVEGLRGKAPAMTTLIVVACAALGGLTLLWGSKAGYEQTIVSLGATNGREVMSGEYFRLFASMFLHWSPTHFLMNMLALWSFGVLLEPILGPRRFLVLYGLSGLGGALATTLIGNADRWSAGASGAIWGLMTATLAIVLRPRGVLPPLLVSRLKTTAWRPVLINLGISFFPGIDMLAHLGGGVVGFVLAGTVLTSGLVPMDERGLGGRAEARSGLVPTISAAVLVVAMAASVLVGVVKSGQPPAMKRVEIPGTSLSLELPEPVAKQVNVEEREGSKSYRYGDRDHSPVIFEVIPVNQTVTPEDVDALLEVERKSFDEHPPADLTPVGKARIVTVGNRKAVVGNYSNPGFAARMYILVAGDREIVVNSYSGDKRPEAWKGIEEKVIESIVEK